MHIYVHLKQYVLQIYFFIFVLVISIQLYIYSTISSAILDHITFHVEQHHHPAAYLQVSSKGVKVKEFAGLIPIAAGFHLTSDQDVPT